MAKFSIWLDKNISGGSTTARFGFVGILIAFILFAPQLVIYFLAEGGLLMFSSIVWIVLGIILAVMWVATLIFAIILIWRWWKNRLTDTTPQRLTNIEGAINNLINLIKEKQWIDEE